MACHLTGAWWMPPGSPDHGRLATPVKDQMAKVSCPRSSELGPLSLPQLASRGLMVRLGKLPDSGDMTQVLT